MPEHCNTPEPWSYFLLLPYGYLHVLLLCLTRSLSTTCSTCWHVSISVIIFTTTCSYLHHIYTERENWNSGREEGSQCGMYFIIYQIIYIVYSRLSVFSHQSCSRHVEKNRPDAETIAKDRQPTTARRVWTARLVYWTPKGRRQLFSEKLRRCCVQGEPDVKYI